MTDLTLADFDFDLPEELIALRPARPRPASRLLVARGKGQEAGEGPGQVSGQVSGPVSGLEHATVADLGRYLRAGDLLVFNDTKVIPARLRGTRTRDSAHGSGVAQIEVTLIAIRPDASWTALCKPARRLAPGDRIVLDPTLHAQVLARRGGEVDLRFNLTGRDLDLALERLGEVPLPPYIAGRRAADAQDRSDYQTVFARHAGAVAAPTASLHFTQDLIAGLEAAGIATTFVTLHVGAGTFLPVTVEDVARHKMHAEWGEVADAAAAAIAATRAAGGRVIPVGTTAMRLIETAARGPGGIAPFRGDTDIFIRPGFEFRASDGLMTNFHLPRSTLMMLVSALMGTERIRDIYRQAIEERYRFFSYGDSSLLLPGS